MNLGKEYQIKGTLWLWNSEKGSWHFFTVPQNIAEEIYFEQKLSNLGKTRGFGTLKCKVKIGETEFETSMFPNSKDKTYVLPVKLSVRKAENLVAGKEITLTLYV